MAVLIIPKVLREKLSDEGADALVDLINRANDKQKEDILTFLEEKFETKLLSAEEKISSKISIVEEKFERRLAEEIGKLRNEIAEARAELRTEITEAKATLEVKGESNKADLIKWMFIFWVGQVAVLTGILFAFFRK